jgi:hypothetical protein
MPSKFQDMISQVHVTNSRMITDLKVNKPQMQKPRSEKGLSFKKKRWWSKGQFKERVLNEHSPRHHWNLWLDITEEEAENTRSVWKSLESPVWIPRGDYLSPPVEIRHSSLPLSIKDQWFLPLKVWSLICFQLCLLFCYSTHLLRVFISPLLFSTQCFL